jgi:hypothetical protein
MMRSVCDNTNPYPTPTSDDAAASNDDHVAGFVELAAPPRDCKGTLRALYRTHRGTSRNVAAGSDRCHATRQRAEQVRASPRIMNGNRELHTKQNMTQP